MDYANRLARDLGHANAESAAALDGWCPRSRREWSDLIRQLAAERREARAAGLRLAARTPSEWPTDPRETARA